MLTKEEYRERLETKEGRRKLATRQLLHMLFCSAILTVHFTMLHAQATNWFTRWWIPIFVGWMILSDLNAAYSALRHKNRYNNLACRTIYHQLKNGHWKSVKAIKVHQRESDRLYTVILGDLVDEGLLEKTQLGYRIAPGKQVLFRELVGAMTHPIPLSLRTKQARRTR